MNPANLLKGILFSNVFYGVCAVALAVETDFQQQIPLASPLFYLVIFGITIVYYTHAYRNQYLAAHENANERTWWYYRNRHLLPYTQVILSAIVLGASALLVLQYATDLRQVSGASWIILCAFALLTAFYYGIELPGRGLLSLRSIGLIKPFLIGMIWAGTVSVLPVFFHDLTHHSTVLFSTTTLFLLIKNWLFISILCILFDIKDYAEDHNLQLKTFVVRFGLRKTLFEIILPMAVASWCCIILVVIAGNFPLARILINAIPFLLLITVCYSMYQRKTILYYLAIIDGLMLVKAACGIIGMVVLK
jgi:hypothetical protein